MGKRTIAGLALGLALTACQAPAPSSPAAAEASPGPVATTAPMPKYEAPRVTPQEAKARLDAGEEIVVVDVRGASHYQAGHIPGAVSAPWATLSEGHKQLPKDKLLLLYCT